ncbi:MAG: preprotein translocase subunit SecG [Acidobacteria bacterium]|nr:preprotein translocase subunit SecG [Acidobacteriota bacterium]|tara:strand:+ start:509 stop:895 length:387 start_codon:yes stop_codon:yes gene_type:complete
MVGILLNALYVVTCLLLVAVVLMQQGKGGDIAAAFGGSGSQTAFGARAGATVLTRATTVLGILFMVGAMALAITGQSSTGSVLSGVDGPGLPTAAPATAPVEIPAPDTPAEAPAETSEEAADTPAAPQ